MKTLTTLLCYLQLQGLLQLLSPLNDTCTLKCYGGPGQLRALKRKLPPLGIAIRLDEEKGNEVAKSNCLSFSLTQVSDLMKCESSIVRYQVQGLAYNDYGTSQQSSGALTHSSVMVEWSDLSFHIRSRGNLSDTKRDTICHGLYEKVKKREEKEIEKLHLLYASLRGVAEDAKEEEEEDVTDKNLKRLIQQYFKDEVTSDVLAAMGISTVAPTDTPLNERQKSQVRQSINTLMAAQTDVPLTGRAIARLLHGIFSPCFPAEVWGRRALHWRRHTEVDFNTLCEMATQQLIGNL